MSSSTTTSPAPSARRPRHVTVGGATAGRLASRWLLTLRWHLLLLFTSDLGRSIIERKYDAFTTDAAYDASPSGRWLIGRYVDRIVRSTDTHVALRQRLDIVADEIVDAAIKARATAPPPVRIVSGPCGLARDVRTAWARLEAQGLSPSGWLDITGLDLDASGDVLATAAERCQEQGIPFQGYRRDLLIDGTGHPDRGRVQIYLSMGLTTWLDDDDLEHLLRSCASTMGSNGVLLIDNWRPHRGSRYVGALDLPGRYREDAAFEAALSRAGWRIQRKTPSPNGVVVVYRAIVSS